MDELTLLQQTMSGLSHLHDLGIGQWGEGLWSVGGGAVISGGEAVVSGGLWSGEGVCGQGRGCSQGRAVVRGAGW